MGSDLWLVVGLGNPEPRYEGNRHNVGFMVVDVLSEAEGLGWRSSTRFSAELAKGAVARQEAVLLKPQTFMNLSGRAVSPVAGFYGVPAERIVAVHDDVDLDLGRLRLKTGGGDGGHKGIRSMAQELGTPAFIRVRVGVGRPQVGDVTDFVLQDFRREECDAASEQVRRAADAVRMVLTRGLREAMNAFNGPLEGRERAERSEKPQNPRDMDSEQDKQEE